MASVKKNFLYSSVLTSANYVFPLIVYPYVSRVLGVTNIGLCNWIDGIINYFVLFSMMGISITGIREIAENQGDKLKQSTVYSSLLTLNIVSTLISLLCLVLATLFVTKLRENWELMTIGGVKLVFNLFLIEWFYKGIENFKFITVRTIIVKCVYVGAVFIFVREKDDVLFYYGATSVIVVLNSIINTTYAHKFVKFSLRGINWRPFITPFLTMGLYMLLTSMYTSFNVTFLGFVGGETQVGYYTTSTKLYMILISIFAAFTGVMLPRMTNLIANGKVDEFKENFTKSVNGLVTFCMPVIVFVIVYSAQLVWLLSGPGYEGASIPMKIVIPLMLIIGYEQILVIQTLMPLKADKAIFRNSVCGAVVGIVLNILLVKNLGAIGSAIVWVGAEFTILVLSQWEVKKRLQIPFQFKFVSKNIIAYLPLFFILFYLNKIVENLWLTLGCGIGVLCVYFLIINLFILRNELVMKLAARFRGVI